MSDLLLLWKEMCFISVKKKGALGCMMEPGADHIQKRALLVRTNYLLYGSVVHV